MHSTPAEPPEPSPGQMLEAAYAQHAPACRLYAHQLIGAAGAEDACQEAFIRLMRHLVREGRPPRAPRAWLVAATRSAALDLARGERRRRRREAKVMRDEPFVPSPGAGLDEQGLSEALSTLPQRQREVIVLRLWGEMGFAEIGALLSVSTSTAHADYASGLSTLRERLATGPLSSGDRRLGMGIMR